MLQVLRRLNQQPPAARIGLTIALISVVICLFFFLPGLRPLWRPLAWLVVVAELALFLGLYEPLERWALSDRLARIGSGTTFALDRSGRFLWGGDQLPPAVRAETARLLLGAWEYPEGAPFSCLLTDQAGTPVTCTVYRVAGVRRDYLAGVIAPLLREDIQGRLYRSALDFIDTGTALRTLDGEIFWQNETHARLVASGAGEYLNLAGQQTPAPQSRNVEVQLPDGRVIAQKVYPVRHAQTEQLLAVVSLSRDVTEQRRVQIQMEQAARAVAIGQLAAGMAHNLNNLLGNVALTAELLRTAAPEETPALIDDLVEEVRQAGEILTRLNQPAGDTASPRREELDAHSLLRQTAQLIATRAAGQGIEVQVSVPRGTRVLADPGLLHQVLLNLALNSVQAMATGGCLMLAAESAAEGRTTLSVADSGEGIAPEDLPQLFTPFFTTRRKRGGTGLGLSTSLTMVKAMGGEMRLESTWGFGTTVHLELPSPALATRGD